MSYSSKGHDSHDQEEVQLLKRTAANFRVRESTSFEMQLYAMMKGRYIYATVVCHQLNGCHAYPRPCDVTLNSPIAQCGNSKTAELANIGNSNWSALCVCMCL